MPQSPTREDKIQALNDRIDWLTLHSIKLGELRQHADGLYLADTARAYGRPTGSAAKDYISEVRISISKIIKDHENSIANLQIEGDVRDALKRLKQGKGTTLDQQLVAMSYEESKGIK